MDDWDLNASEESENDSWTSDDDADIPLVWSQQPREAARGLQCQGDTVDTAPEVVDTEEDLSSSSEDEDLPLHPPPASAVARVEHPTLLTHAEHTPCTALVVAAHPNHDHDVLPNATGVRLLGSTSPTADGPGGRDGLACISPTAPGCAVYARKASLVVDDAVELSRLLTALAGYLIKCGGEPAHIHAALEGWSVRIEQRVNSGSTNGSRDVYYFNPSGSRFRSRAEVARHLVLRGAPPLPPPRPLLSAAPAATVSIWLRVGEGGVVRARLTTASCGQGVSKQRKGGIGSNPRKRVWDAVQQSTAREGASASAWRRCEDSLSSERSLGYSGSEGSAGPVSYHERRVGAGWLAHGCNGYGELPYPYANAARMHLERRMATADQMMNSHAGPALQRIAPLTASVCPFPEEFDGQMPMHMPMHMQMHIPMPMPMQRPMHMQMQTPMGMQMGSSSYGQMPMGMQMGSSSYGQMPIGTQMGSSSYGQMPIGMQMGSSSYGQMPIGTQMGSSSYGQMPIGMPPDPKAVSDLS